MPDDTQSLAKINIDTEEALEDREIMINELGDLEIDDEESVDEDEINLELSDFNLSA